MDEMWLNRWMNRWTSISSGGSAPDPTDEHAETAMRRGTERPLFRLVFVVDLLFSVRILLETVRGGACNLGSRVLCSAADKLYTLSPLGSVSPVLNTLGIWNKHLTDRRIWVRSPVAVYLQRKRDTRS